MFGVVIGTLLILSKIYAQVSKSFRGSHTLSCVVGILLAESLHYSLLSPEVSPSIILTMNFVPYIV